MQRTEVELDSTGRELAGMSHTLEAFEEVILRELQLALAGLRGEAARLCGRQVILCLDSQAAARILSVGSKKVRLHRIAKTIFAQAMRHSWNLIIRWRRRDTREGRLADDIGKISDCDFQLAPKRVRWLEY